MKIALIEPFFSGSHQQWALEFQQKSQHEVHIFQLKGRHWKWRMAGGALPLAEALINSGLYPDLILCSDMLDLASFKAFLPIKFSAIPLAVYFHENQITYPWSPSDSDLALERDHHYGYINFKTASVADAVFFNSSFHKNSFLTALPKFLRKFPDYRSLHKIEEIRQKSQVLPLACDLSFFDKHTSPSKDSPPILLWNHRWEYDKDPELFFKILIKLKNQGHPFKVIILGEAYKKAPSIFKEAKQHLSKEIFHFGFADSRKKYAALLWMADIIPVTSRQEFFGLSVVEAIYCNCYPILPKRLSYPEHIPEEYHDIYLYQNENELFEKLKTAIHKIHDIRVNKQYRDFVAQYDWSNLAPRYDERFYELVQMKR